MSGGILRKFTLNIALDQMHAMIRGDFGGEEMGFCRGSALVTAAEIIFIFLRARVAVQMGVLCAATALPRAEHLSREDVQTALW